MSTKRYKPEQVVNILRQIEVENANGKTTPQACRDAQITVQTYYRWRKEYGGLKVGQAKRLKELEKENCATETASGGAVDREAGFAGCGAGKLLSPERRRCRWWSMPERQFPGRASGMPVGCWVAMERTFNDIEVGKASAGRNFG